MNETGPLPVEDPEGGSAPPVDPTDGGTTVSAGGSSLRLAWHVRGDAAEVTLDADGAPGTAGRGGELAAADEELAEALGQALARVAATLDARGVDVSFAVDHPATSLHPLPEAAADRAGFTERRDLYQLRRPLPVPPDHPSRARVPAVAVRPFAGDGSDADAWVRVNNRAFAGHPDQGSETPETLADRLRRPEVDLAGFLLADDPARPGELGGFCWTLVHPATATDPELGEIYVIGVDPSHQGQGWGPALVLAGLDHLAARGVRDAVLYVDETNTPARALYEKLGFVPHLRRRVYRP